jgi:hypothetical protein
LEEVVENKQGKMREILKGRRNTSGYEEREEDNKRNKNNTKNCVRFVSL